MHVHFFATGESSAGYARVKTSRQPPLVSMANILSGLQSARWLPDLSKTRARCGIRRARQYFQRNHSVLLNYSAFRGISSFTPTEYGAIAGAIGSRNNSPETGFNRGFNLGLTAEHGRSLVCCATRSPSGHLSCLYISAFQGKGVNYNCCGLRRSQCSNCSERD